MGVSLVGFVVLVERDPRRGLLTRVPVDPVLTLLDMEAVWGPVKGVFTLSEVGQQVVVVDKRCPNVSKLVAASCRQAPDEPFPGARACSSHLEFKGTILSTPGSGSLPVTGIITTTAQLLFQPGWSLGFPEVLAGVMARLVPGVP